MHYPRALLLTAVPTLFSFATASDPRILLRDSQGNSVDAKKTWDFVIIGSGPAGFVLYNQLSQDSSKSVALLEAGPNGAADPLIYTPALAPFNTEPIGNQYAWNYTVHTAQADVELDQGHVLGGGSSVNYNTYCRGAPSVFDEWATISGNNDLKWNNLFNDFQETTHYAERPNSAVQQVIQKSAYGNGPLEITHFAMLNGFDPSWFNTLKNQLNLSEVDMNAGPGSSLGVTYGTETIFAKNGTRDSSFTSFGYAAAGRSNAQIIQGATATRIGFDGKTAKNVTYQKDSQQYVINAKEIIVSGGAINTPKLLLLSGVGPKAQLQSFNISVVADVPGVGSNLRDHGISGIEVQVKSNVQTTWQYLYNTTFVAQAESEFAATGEGFLAQNGAGAFAVVRAPDSVFQGTGSFHTSLPADRGQLLFQYVTAAAIAGGPNVSIVSPFVSLVQPEASGTVTLASADYRDDPIIDPNYYGSAGDKAAILWGYKKLRSMMKASTMSPAVIKEVYPGDAVTSDADLMNAVQKTLHSFHHPVGTVALGTVLDKNFRVKGLKGLRVIDSSVFPFPPTCHPQADVYALAHSAAQKIKSSG